MLWRLFRRKKKKNSLKLIFALSKVFSHPELNSKISSCNHRNLNTNFKLRNTIIFIHYSSAIDSPSTGQYFIARPEPRL